MAITTDISSNGTGIRIARRIARAASAVLTFFGDIARAGHAAGRYQQLATLNERELGQLGITSKEAARAAYNESFGKL